MRLWCSLLLQQPPVKLHVCPPAHLCRATGHQQFQLSARRTMLWDVAIYFFLKSPLWGYGFAAGYYLIIETPYGIINADLGTGHYHSSYLALLVDTSELRGRLQLTAE